jgi:hypothetical protein
MSRAVFVAYPRVHATKQGPSWSLEAPESHRRGGPPPLYHSPVAGTTQGMPEQFWRAWYHYTQLTERLAGCDPTTDEWLALWHEREAAWIRARSILQGLRREGSR